MAQNGDSVPRPKKSNLEVLRHCIEKARTRLREGGFWTDGRGEVHVDGHIIVYLNEALYRLAKFEAAEEQNDGSVRDGSLNAPINEPDAVVLRNHILRDHRSLLDPVCDGPLPANLAAVPNDVLAAIHTANHMVVWRDHDTDHWKVDE